MSINIIAVALGAVALLLSTDQLLHYLTKEGVAKESIAKEPPKAESEQQAPIPWPKTTDKPDRLAA